MPRCGCDDGWCLLRTPDHRKESTRPNFDNVLNALVTLFILTSGEDWNVYMLNGVDATNSHRSMRQNAHPAAAYYYVVFMCFSSFFFLGLVRRCFAVLNTGRSTPGIRSHTACCVGVSSSLASSLRTS